MTVIFDISERARAKENESLKCLIINLCCNIKRKAVDLPVMWQYYGELYSSDGTLLDYNNH